VEGARNTENQWVVVGRTGRGVDQNTKIRIEKGDSSGSSRSHFGGPAGDQIGTYRATLKTASDRLNS